MLFHLHLLLLCQESYTYRDPITEFLECLYVNFDFDGAQQKLRECETVMIRIAHCICARYKCIYVLHVYVHRQMPLTGNYITWFNSTLPPM